MPNKFLNLLVYTSLIFSPIAYAGYAESSKIVDDYNREKSIQEGQNTRATIHRNAARYLNAFARSHGGAVTAIQIRVNDGLTVSEFTTADGYDCAMMATHNMILKCANPYTHKRINKVVRVL